MKECKKCKQLLDSSLFYKDSSRKDGLRWCCISCTKKTKKLFRENNKEHIKQQKKQSYLRHREGILQRKKDSPTKYKDRREHLLSVYGISFNDYDRMREEQNFKCAICETHEQDVKRGQSASVETSLHIDHCHTTNKVRGLLCMNCNNLLGKANDNTNILHKAINYLNKGLT
jgi:hypothetical protein